MTQLPKPAPRLGASRRSGAPDTPRKTFDADYFAGVTKAGIGLGINPSDFHIAYLDDRVVDFLEVTAPSSRLRGAPGYRDIGMRPRGPGFARRGIEDLVADTKVLVHSTNVNPAYPEPCTYEDLREIEHLVAVSGAPWVTEDLGVWLMNERHIYPFFMPLPHTSEVLTTCVDNVKSFQDTVGVPFNAEFPPTTIIVGDIHPFDFFRVLTTEAGCGMCLDIGHILSYQLARDASPMADAHRLPWDAITEIHIAGGGIDLTAEGFLYQDDHGDREIVSVCLDMLDEVIAHAPNLRAITLELFGARRPQQALNTLAALRERKSVATWLADETVNDAVLPQPQAALEVARSQQLGLYDLLHSDAPIDARSFRAAGSEVLDMFATRERRRWDYERQSRLQLVGGALADYFPRTTKYVTDGKLITLDELHALVLASSPGDGPGMWEALVSCFEKLVVEEHMDRTADEIFRCELWMNECVRMATDDRRTFPIDVFADEPETRHRVTTLSFHDGRLHRINGDDLSSRGECTLDDDGDGTAPCCTGV